MPPGRKDLFGALIAGRRYGPYDDSGNPEHCSGNQYDTQYRDYAALYQLRRDVGGISALRNGACPERVRSDRIGLKEEFG